LCERAESLWKSNRLEKALRSRLRCQPHRKRNVAESEIPGVVEFLAIGEDPEKFKAFLSAAAAAVQK
jgi:hypothetical protein